MYEEILRVNLSKKTKKGIGRKRADVIKRHYLSFLYEHVTNGRIFFGLLSFKSDTFTFLTTRRDAAGTRPANAFQHEEIKLDLP